MAVFWEKVTGRYAPFFWTMMVTCFIIPFSILCRGKTRTVTGCLIAGICVTIGMWLERFTIVLPTLVNPRLPYPRGSYVPSIVEVLITVGFFATFSLLYMIFTKLFPIISIWEIKEGPQSIKDTVKRIREYLPPVVKPEEEA